MKLDEIKNCPCCNGEAKVEKGLIFTMIMCKKCRLQIFDENKKVDSLIKK